MTEPNTANAPKLAIVASRGTDDERCNVAWTIANVGQKQGQDVTMFLVASAVDVVRKGAIDNVNLNPFDPPLKELVDAFKERGGKILACPPCAKVRGYDADDLIDGVEIVGSTALHALLMDGANTLCF
jgi:predicted peroxiredoxin